MKNNTQIILFSLFVFIQAQQSPPKLFQYNQATFQGFYFFKDVMIDSLMVEEVDWVGSFNCKEWNSDSTFCSKLGPCVGARQWIRSRCGGGVCDLPAMGIGGEAADKTIGYLNTGEYPAFLIYDKSKEVYYSAEPKGDVKLQDDDCRNGYPFCYAWKNHGFVFAEKLITKEIYLDCSGKIHGKSIVDQCGVCGGDGPQFKCNNNKQSYCTEYEYQQHCIDHE